MSRVLLGLLACLIGAGAARASDHPTYAPAPEWVKPQPIPVQASAIGDAATKVLLQNDQYRLGKDQDEYFTETARKLLSPTGLSDMGSVAIVWDPDTDELVIHKVSILRGDKVIDALAGGSKVTVLRRETGLEMSKLDGALTANLQVEGLQVGDVLDTAFTIKRRDPVRQGHSDGFDGLFRPGLISRAYVRMIWPKSKPVKWKLYRGMPAPVVSADGDMSEIVLAGDDLTVPKAPAQAPGRYDTLAMIDFSDFAGWTELSATMAPRYAKAATLKPDSELKAEIETIRRSSSDPEKQALAALQLVEDKVRYFFLGMNSGGYIPADADLTWARRFGDCKGKTVLLLALLHGLGIEAEPTLVSTTIGDGLNARLPTLSVFDHVIVRAHIRDRYFWLDGTRLGDYRLEQPEIDYQWALPLRAGGAELLPMERRPLSSPNFESTVRLDATAGLDRPAQVHVEHIYSGESGLSMGLDLDATSKADLTHNLKAYWRKEMSWIDPATVSYSFNRATGQTTVVADGVATVDWAKSGSARDFDVADSSLGWAANYKREPGPDADAPFAINLAFFKRWTVVVKLPTPWDMFSLVNAAPVNENAAGMSFTRRAQIERGTATIVAEERALAPEFPASEAASAVATLRQMADYDVVIRARTPISDADKRAGAAALAAFNALVEKANADSSAPTLLAGIKPIIQMPGFAQLDRNTQSRSWRILSWAAKETNDPKLALEAADKAIAIGPPDSANLRLKLEAQLALKDHDGLARTLALYARSLPDHLKELNDDFVARTVHDARGDARFEVLAALYDGHWEPTKPLADPSGMWLIYATALLDRGDYLQAEQVARRITLASSFISMHADKRFDTLIAHDPKRYDVATALDANLARFRENAAKHPDLLEGVARIGWALLERDKPEEALALFDGAIARAKSNDGAAPAYSDQDDQLRIILEARAEALEALGRGDEALRSHERAAQRPEHGAVNVSQTLDLAERYVSVGRAGDALETLQDVDPRKVSGYGMMVYKSAAACAAAQLGDKAKADEAVTFLKAHMDDGKAMLSAALICVDDADATAREMIAALEDKDSRTDTLHRIQHFLPPRHQTPWDAKMRQRRLAILERPDVKAEVRKVGRIDSYPIH